MASFEISDWQRDCLRRMGVEIYRPYTPPPAFIGSYWLCLDEELTEATRGLLEKMVLALRWSMSDCVILSMADYEKKHTVGESAKKGIIFSDRTIQTLPQDFLLLPALKTLVGSVELKRIAWKKMQILFHV